MRWILSFNRVVGITYLGLSVFSVPSDHAASPLYEFGGYSMFSGVMRQLIHISDYCTVFMCIDITVRIRWDTAYTRYLSGIRVRQMLSC